MADALDMLKANASVGSTAGILRDRNAANAAAAAGVESGAVPVPAGLPAGAAMVNGVASPMEMAVRAKLKAAQDAKLQMLLRQRGVGAAMNAPVISADPNLVQ